MFISLQNPYFLECEHACRKCSASLRGSTCWECLSVLHKAGERGLLTAASVDHGCALTWTQGWDCSETGSHVTSGMGNELWHKAHLDRARSPHPLLAVDSWRSHWTALGGAWCPRIITPMPESLCEDKRSWCCRPPVRCSLWTGDCVEQVGLSTAEVCGWWRLNLALPFPRGRESVKCR